MLDSVNAFARKVAPYAKAAVAVLGVAMVTAKALADGELTMDEVTEIAIAIGVASGVYAVPNKPAA